MKFDQTIEQIADAQLNNVLYRMSRADNFTGSSVIHQLCADSTGNYQQYIMKRLREMAKEGTIIEHNSGPKQIYVKSKESGYGRNNRPTNLYRFKSVETT